MSTSKTVVHIVGTGTIGEPLTGLFLDHKTDMGIDEVTFHKRTPLLIDRSKVRDLCRRGARLATDTDRADEFRAMGLEPTLTQEEALEQATVVVDCTPAGNKNKAQYAQFEDSTRGFIAQGSEKGFGKPYARGINDSALTAGEDRYIQVVSCNTHNISLLLQTIGYKNGTDFQNLREAQFVCMRRANDITQTKSFVPSLMVGNHTDERFGTHHAADAHRLFGTLGIEPNCYSSALKLNTQYMHAIWFHLKTESPIDRAGLVKSFEHNDLVSMTYKHGMHEVFGFGRDHGHYGRILNQTVIVPETLFVHGDGRQVSGFCFTPQDGNSLLSSVAATCWFLDPEGYEDRFQCLKQYFFEEV
ncbi:MAG: hypothetical protein ACYS22_12175 [Planctomycetota bacterium]|jgi:glyceraldehyde-3-phosphate dehydrogenase (NAD(P))